MNTILEQTEDGKLHLTMEDPAAEMMRKAEAEERARETQEAVQRAVEVGRAIAGDNEAEERVRGDMRYGYILSADAMKADAQAQKSALGYAMAEKSDAPMPMLLERLEEVYAGELKEAGYKDGFEAGRGLSWNRDDYARQIGELTVALGRRDMDVKKKMEENAERKGEVMKRYAQGEELEGEDAAVMNEVVVEGGKQYEDLAAVRAFKKTYLDPIFKDGGNVRDALDRLDGLQDEMYDCIGESPERAEMVRAMLLDWAEGGEEEREGRSEG